jgi:hypothetical protein
MCEVNFITFDMTIFKWHWSDDFSAQTTMECDDHEKRFINNSILLEATRCERRENAIKIFNAISWINNIQRNGRWMFCALKNYGRMRCLPRKSCKMSKADLCAYWKALVKEGKSFAYLSGINENNFWNLFSTRTFAIQIKGKGKREGERIYFT